jgi:hypothetical protein
MLLEDLLVVPFTSTPAYLDSLRGTLGTDPSLTPSIEGH